MSDLREKYNKVFESLNRVDLQKAAPGLDEVGLEDLLGRRDEKWLGFYTPDGIRTALDRYGLFSDLAQIGFMKTEIEVRTDDPDEHTLRVFSRQPPHSEPLVELVVRRSTLEPTHELKGRINGQYLHMLQVEWLLLQNPELEFDEKRPPVPGQVFPGLGVGKQVMEILRNTTMRLKLDGLVTIPSYFHNAFIYSEEFFFFDPNAQGRFLAICRDVLPQTQSNVGAASWALAWQLVRMSPNGQPFAWFHSPQVYPVSDRLVAYFEAAEFDREVAQSLSAIELEVDREGLKRKLEETGIYPFDKQRLQQLLHP